VIAAARTGNERRRRKAVTKTDQTKRGMVYISIPRHRILRMVTMKLMAPKIDEAPDRWRLKIAKSTAGPEWAWIPDKGGYTVHPVPAPPSAKLERRTRIRDGGRSQKLTLLSRGKAISGAPIRIGTNQFPKPPIRTGMTIKKIIKKACAVTTTL
jgi:hypothetical protein